MGTISQGFQSVFAGYFFEAGAVQLVGERFGLDEVPPCACGRIAIAYTRADEMLE